MTEQNTQNSGLVTEVSTPATPEIGGTGQQTKGERVAEQQTLVKGYDDGVHVTRSGKACHIRHTDVMAVTYGAEVLVKRYNKPVTLYKPLRRAKAIRTGLNSRREDNLKRASRDARRIALSNYPLKPAKYSQPVWLTLTYKDEERGSLENREQVTRDMQVFFRDLRALYGKQIKYIYTLEIQPKRLKDTGKKVLHMHTLIFNMPYNDRDKVFAMWKYGEPQAQEMKRLKFGHTNGKENVDKLSRYMSKKVHYMLKDGVEVEANKKIYTVSQGLDRPEKWSDPEMVRLLLEQKMNEGYTRRVINDEPYYSPHYDAHFDVEVWEPV